MPPKVDPITREELGQIVYDAFRTACFGRSPLTGAPLPPWSELQQTVRDTLDAAVDAIS